MIRAQRALHIPAIFPAEPPEVLIAAEMDVPPPPFVQTVPQDGLEAVSESAMPENTRRSGVQEI